MSEVLQALTDTFSGSIAAIFGVVVGFAAVIFIIEQIRRVNA